MNIPPPVARLALLFPVTALVVLGHHVLAQQLGPSFGRLPMPASGRFAQLVASFLVHVGTAWWLLPLALQLLQGRLAAVAVRQATGCALAVVFARSAWTVVAPQPMQAPWLLLALGAAAVGSLAGIRPRHRGLSALPPRFVPLPPPSMRPLVRRAS